MIKVSVFYPNTEGTSFDIEYYCNKHIPFCQEKLGDALRDVAVEKGVSGAQPGSGPAYIAMGHLYFDSIEDFQNSFGPNAEAIQNDIPNYTDTKPIIQISEVKM